MKATIAGIEKALEGTVTADEALKLTQAILNLAHAARIIEDTKRVTP